MSLFHFQWNWNWISNRKPFFIYLKQGCNKFILEPKVFVCEIFSQIFCITKSARTMIDMSMLLAQSNSKNFFTTLSRFSEFGLFVSSSNRFDYRLPFWFTRFPLSDPIRLQRLFWPFMGLAVANVRAWWGNKRCTIYSGKLRSKLIFFQRLSTQFEFKLHAKHSLIHSTKLFLFHTKISIHHFHSVKMALLKVDNKLAIAIVFVAAICGLAQCVRVEVNNFILIGFHARSWTFPQYVFGHWRRKCGVLWSLGKFKFGKPAQIK